MAKEPLTINNGITAIIDNKQDIEWWNDEEDLKDFCAQELTAGRLVLVLGAGISSTFGLPEWTNLLKDTFRHKRSPMPRDKKNPSDIAEYLLVHVCEDNEIEFANAVRNALYKDFKLTPQSLASKPLLNALGALTMPSVRGNVKEVVTFNFDDLLETYLRFFGFVSQSLSQIPFWGSRADVRIYHPHGLLTSDMTLPIENGILMARVQFQRRSESVKMWYEKLYGVLQSNTCLFIGLSGDDDNMTNLLQKVYENHVCRSHGSKSRYWGIRFIDKRKDPNRDNWVTRGIYQQPLRNYDQLPNWLFDVCQRASRNVTI